MDLVLVHGAYHGAWCWDRLIPELVARGHRPVTVDLPIGEPEAGAGEYAGIVTEVASDLDGPVVVGHSMAGLVLPLVAASTQVSAMVFLAAFLPEPGSSLAEQRAREPIDPNIDFTVLEFTDIGDGVYRIGRDTATEMFYSDVPTAERAWALDRLRPQSYRFMEETTPLVEWPDVRSTYIVCRDDHAVNPEWGRSAARERLNVEAHEIDGGHSPFLRRPAELAELLNEITSVTG